MFCSPKKPFLNQQGEQQVNDKLNTKEHHQNPTTTVDSNISSPFPQCRVVLEDILLSSSAEKLKSLGPNLDRNHCVLPRQTNDKLFLLHYIPKTPIAWPRMDEDDKWNKLDCAVSNHLKSLPTSLSLTDKVNFLESSIYNEALNLFGHHSAPRQKILKINRRTLHSIILVNEKNLLSKQVLSCLDEERPGLQALLSEVKSKLRSLRRSEKGRKKRWKAKAANKAFFKNPYHAGRELLDPKCTTKLQTDLKSHYL